MIMLITLIFSLILVPLLGAIFIIIFNKFAKQNKNYFQGRVLKFFSFLLSIIIQYLVIFSNSWGETFIRFCLDDCIQARKFSIDGQGVILSTFYAINMFSLFLPTICITVISYMIIFTVLKSTKLENNN